ncbi:esterase lipase protein [Rutstroemia sp. NJR-2017a BBW]|nr:esterase lipase protein [Rutstroemia sp. NJR-2017a BBW]
MSANEGRQSPDPESQSGAQVNDPPSDAKGISQGEDSKKESKSDIEGLSSNPSSALGDHPAKTVEKTTEPNVKS